VRKADVHRAVTASGYVDSSEKTIIECELESVTLSADGRSFSAKGASMIIDLIPEGTVVAEGDVLCRLDSSEFEELCRQQEIQVQRARTDLQKTGFDVQAAEIAFTEYAEGLLPQSREELDSQWTIAASEIERQRDRLAWAERMVEHKYYGENQLVREQQSLLRAEITLNRTARQKDILDHFDSKTRLIRLQAAIDRARTELSFQELRLKRREEQLERFQTQVERCTIRAPHTGIVVYANGPDNDPRVELGSTVYQKMDLFYLPDLKHMEVMTRLNESVVARVALGMTALVRVEALPDQELEGEVVMVTALPLPPIGRASPDVRTYLARVKLAGVPSQLKPGMSAEVRIITDRHPQALVVPSTSVTFEGGTEVCYVSSDAGLERRVVAVSSATPALLEVRSGLEPGEQVILDPSQIEPGSQLISHSAPSAVTCGPPADSPEGSER
jgi:HlyD family secretion protein